MTSNQKASVILCVIASLLMLGHFNAVLHNRIMMAAGWWMGAVVMLILAAIIEVSDGEDFRHCRNMKQDSDQPALPTASNEADCKELLCIVEKYSDIIYTAPLPHPDHIHAAVKEACEKAWAAATEAAAETVERCGLTYAAGDSSILAENATGAIAAAVRMGSAPNTPRNP